MLNERSLPARALGDGVRAASEYQGPWPRVSVWHGSADPIVRPSNGEDIIRQWTDVNGLAAHPSREEKLAGHIRRIWNDANGNTLVEAFSISNMGHGVPLATGLGVANCGAAGPFFLDVGLSSTHHIAQSWGLGEVGAEAWNAETTMVTSAASGGGSSCEVDAIARAGGAPERGVAGFKTQRASPSPNLNGMIAAALKAAGAAAGDYEPATRLAERCPGPDHRGSLEGGRVDEAMSGAAADSDVFRPIVLLGPVGAMP